jgi:hypothetical protein
MAASGYKIISCQHCTQLYESPTNISLYVDESDYYSDGYISSISYLEIRSIVKCVSPFCGKVFNSNNAKVIAELAPLEFEKPKWKNVFRLGGYEMETGDLEETLTSEFCKNEENEKKVRTFLLWKYNNQIRKNKLLEFSPEIKQKASTNAEELLKLIHEDAPPGERIFKAELYRECSQFDACIKLLLEIKHENRKEKIIKEKVFSAAKLKDYKVFTTKYLHVKKEYKCTNCDDQLILFDLDKIQSNKGFKHYHCKAENRIVNADTLVVNPNPGYLQMTHVEYLRTLNYRDLYIPKEKIVCPTCNSEDVALFNVDSQKCVKCEVGNYEYVKWF